MSIHSIQHDYLDLRLKKAEEAGIQQFCVKTMKRLFKGTCQKRFHDLLLLDNLGNGGGLCLSSHSATKNSKSAVTT